MRTTGTQRYPRRLTGIQEVVCKFKASARWKGALPERWHSSPRRRGCSTVSVETSGHLCKCCKALTGIPRCGIIDVVRAWLELTSTGTRCSICRPLALPPPAPPNISSRCHLAMNYSQHCLRLLCFHHARMTSSVGSPVVSRRRPNPQALSRIPIPKRERMMRVPAGGAARNRGI